MQVRSSPIEKETIGKARLKTRRDFLRVQRGGARQRGALVVFMARPGRDSTQNGRLGLVTPKTIGKAHDRNLIKRRFREIFRLHQHEFIENSEMVLIPKKETCDLSYLELE